MVVGDAQDQGGVVGFEWAGDVLIEGPEGFDLVSVG